MNIIDLDTGYENLKSSLTHLTKFFHKKLGVRPSLYDVVSVELTDSKEYEVYWCSYDRDVLFRYNGLIHHYFEQPDNKSLLFLPIGKAGVEERKGDEIGEIKRSRHEYFYFHESYAETPIKFSESFFDTVVLNKSSNQFVIDPTEEETQMENWKQAILAKMNLACASFSKIEFVLNDIRYVAAIWVGFPIDNGNFSKDELYQREIELFLWSHSLNTIAANVQKELARQATKSAIAVIMSRNMSHNIGSHVIPEFIQYSFQEFAKAVQNQEISLMKGVVTGSGSMASFVGAVYDRGADPGNKSQYLKDLEKFHYYLQEKMELIAEAGSTNNTNFCFEYNLEEMINQLIQNKIVIHGLIDNLRLEKAAVNIRFRGADRIINVPGGQLGVQAFYMLLENIIRNCYKHSSPLLTGKDHNNVQYSIQINLSEYTNGREQAFEKDYYIIDVFDRLGAANREDRTADLLDQINSKIDQPIIREGSLRQEGWGLLEMKIAVGFLVNFPLGEIDKGNESITFEGIAYPCLLKAHYYDDEGNIFDAAMESETARNMGYRFHLLKPKFCLLEDAMIDFPCDRVLLRQHGIDSVSSLKVSERLQHQFLIGSPKEGYTNERIINPAVSPLRIGLLQNGSEDSFRAFKSEVWDTYMQSRFPDKEEITIALSMDDLPVDPIRLAQTAVFDLHGNTIRLNDRDFKHASFDELTGVFRYYEPFTSKSGMARILKDRLEMKDEILECIMTSVSVIDERIQDAVNNRDTEQPNLLISELFQLAGIYIPPISQYPLKDYLKDARVLREKIKELLRNRFKEDKYVILHFTLFEKLADSTKKNVGTRYLSELEKEFQLKQQDKYLILMSGRGTPSNLPSNCFYVQLSTVQNALIQKRSKFNLIKVLNAIKRK